METGNDLEVQGGEMTQKADSYDYHGGHLNLPLSVPQFLHL